MSTCLSHKEGVKARKPHRCCFCGDPIPSGSTYDYRSGVDDEGIWKMHMHPECHAYEQQPGTVDWFWYEDCSGLAFSREEAIKAKNKI